MKRLFVVSAAFIMAMATSLASAEDDLWIVVPDYNDVVNAKGWATVAKAQGDFSTCSNYSIQAIVYSSTGEEVNAFIDRFGSINSNKLEFVSPNTGQLDASSHKQVSGKLPIMLRHSDYLPGEVLSIQINLVNGCDQTEKVILTQVTTK